MVVVLHTRYERRVLCRVALLLVLAGAASCSPNTDSEQTGSNSPDAIAAPYGNPGEMALLGTAHKKLPANAVFSDELISDASGEKRVCGQFSLGQHSEKYIFSLDHGIHQDPDTETWQHSCANGWKPGSGY
ncbi:hypothetical protein [Caulobacter sp. 1776]|uniref:hypothetical protein n=1 Tax=Caulobacter sp. 1776 TaxID=3156420 RepID=UPI00339B22FD